MNSGGAAADSAAASANSRAWCGDSSQAGSVFLGSPVSAMAWQRQPPKSASLRAQERQGSGIQSVPRKAWKAGLSDQIQARSWSRTLENSRLGMLAAAWQGSTRPLG